MAGFMDMQRVVKLWQYLDPEEAGTLDRDAVIAALVGDAPNLNADVIAEGIPDVLTDADELRVLSERVDSYVGVGQQTQVSAARRGLWDGVCAGVFAESAAAGNAAAAAGGGGGGGSAGGSAGGGGGGGLTYYDVKELVADIGYVMRGEGVKLEGVDTELAMLAMAEAAGDEAVASPTSVVAPPEVLVAGMCELGELAPVAAAVRCLKVAAERRGQAEKHQVEGLVDQLGAEVDARYGELEIRAPVVRGFDDGVFQAGRRPIRALSDEEVEVLERPSRAAGLPRRARLAPFSPDAELTEDILMETLACWYSKTLDADSPTVVDELVANLRVPKKTEGDDVGDPIAVIAEAAFALHSRLGPSHPHLGPAAMVTLWMLSMEGVDVDRLLKFHDVPPLTLAASSSDGSSGGGGGGEDADAPPDAAAEGGEEDAAVVLASLHDEYSKRFAGKRNQAVLQEVTLAMRDVRESLVLPTTAVRVTVSTLAGLNHAFARESVFVEVSVKGQGTQGTSSVPHAASMAYEQELLFPMVTASAHVRLTLMTTAGVTIGTADLKYPDEEEVGAAPAAAAGAAAAPQTLSVTAMPVVGREGAARQPKLADLTVSVGHASLTPEEMVALVETLGGDLQRQRAGAKLMKWAKVCCLLQALSGPLGAPAFRGAAATAAAAAQHASLEAGAYYATLPPCVASSDEAAARAAADGAAHPVELRMPDAVGVDAAALSFYPEEATVLVAPFSQYDVADVARKGDGATVALQHRGLLGSAGLAAPAALQRFYHACLNDLKRADQQLHDAYDRVLAEKSRHLHHLVTDGDVRLRVREEAAKEEGPLRETTPDHLFDRLLDRLLPLPDGAATAHLPHAPTPLAMCVERAAMPHLLSELILLWYDKEGDIVDELMANLSLPSEMSALAALAQVASFLADCHADQPRNWAEVLTLVLLAVEGADIDNLCMLEDTPRTFSTAAEKQEYVNRVGSSRNPAVLSQLSVALGGMTDYQLSASLAAQGANSVRKAALMEPHRVQKEVVRKWIKTLGMMLILCEPHDGSELHRRATPAPGETERILALGTGPWCLWPAPSRCSKDPAAPPGGTADAALKVHCVVKGLTAALDLTPYQRRHRQGDETPAIVIPPLTSFLVGEVERTGENELCLELLTRETTATVNPAVKRWRAAIERSSARADQRLRDAFYDLGVAKHAQILERNAVTMGKRVVLPDERTVLGTLGEMKEYKLLVNDEVLPTHCGRASVGTVGNVTEAVTTDIPDLRRNLRNLAAEMRGEELDELEEPDEERPQVVSVRFDDDAIYVLPIDLLAVHPITWMPSFPAALRVVVRWAELPDDGTGATPPTPRVRFEVDGAPHVTHITNDPQLPAAPASELSASAAVVAWDGGATGGGGAGGGGGLSEPQPPCQPGESGHVPVWEEAFTVEVDRLRLADAPLGLTFVVFAEQDEEDVDEYEYDRGDETADHTEETTVVGTAALSVSHHVLLETVGRRRTFPLVLSRADQHLLDEVHTIAGHTIANSLMYGNRAGGGGMLYVSLEVVPETEDARSESSDEMATRVADPLRYVKFLLLQKIENVFSFLSFSLLFSSPLPHFTTAGEQASSPQTASAPGATQARTSASRQSTCACTATRSCARTAGTPCTARRAAARTTPSCSSSTTATSASSTTRVKTMTHRVPPPLVQALAPAAPPPTAPPPSGGAKSAP